MPCAHGACCLRCVEARCLTQAFVQATKAGQPTGQPSPLFPPPLSQMLSQPHEHCFWGKIVQSIWPLSVRDVLLTSKLLRWNPGKTTRLETRSLHVCFGHSINCPILSGDVSQTIVWLPNQARSFRIMVSEARKHRAIHSENSNSCPTHSGHTTLAD